MRARWLLLVASISTSTAACEAVDKLRGKDDVARDEDDPPRDVKKKDAPAKKRDVGPLEPTRALVKRPDVAALVDALAEMKAIESSHVGAAGAKSEAFTRFERVRDAATEDEIVALLHHESPVVRGYMAQHVARALGPRIPALEPLLDDETRVGTLQGCMNVPEGSVSGVVREAVCYSPAPEATTLLTKLAGGSSRDQVYAAGCLATKDPKGAARIAHEGMQRGDDQQASFVRILGQSPLPEACADIVRLASSKDDDVRLATAGALGSCESAQAFDALEKLTSDGGKGVARAASVALALHARQTPEGRARILADDKIRSSVMSGLSVRMRNKPVGPFLPLLEELAVNHPRDAGQAFSGFTGGIDDPEVVAMMRRIAGKVAPASSMMELSVRTQAIGFLARKKDHADLPELRRSLTSANASELIDAATALGEMRDTASRAALEVLLRSTNASVVRAAQAAIAKL